MIGKAPKLTAEGLFLWKGGMGVIGGIGQIGPIRLIRFIGFISFIPKYDLIKSYAVKCGK